MLDLQAGQGQMVALLLAMFRSNPDVLVLDRPCAFLTPGQQGRLAVLLALWQGGGAEMLLHCLTGQKRCFRREHTLIVTSQEPKDVFTMATVDLDLDNLTHALIESGADSLEAKESL
ncbi:unnamed protein product [Effrenium voratum]|nr:unnamed protein product [Effrenium voratum]